jgi:CheY-like chemotaxis protein
MSLLYSPLDWLRGSPRGGVPTPGAETDGSETAGKQNRLILAVDDEPDALEFLYTLFATEGFDFTGAESGANALAIIPKRRPDLVVIDVMMPGMNGLELCDLLRSDTSLRHIPIILHSAYEMQKHSNSGLYDAAFTKPAEPEQLLWMVRALLE